MKGAFVMCIRIHLKRFAVLAAVLTSAAVAVMLTVKSVRAEKTSADTTAADVAVVMYHSVCDNNRTKSEYVVSPQTFRADMEALIKEGYTFVSLGDIYEYYTGNGSLPEKPVAVTFDDGFLNNLTSALPVLEELGIKANINVVGSFTERYSSLTDRSVSYACLTWDDIKSLAAGGLVEIGSHTWDMHSLASRKGCARKNGEAADVYVSALRDDIRKLNEALEENCGITPFVFAYPYGEISPEAKSVLAEEGFRVLLTCEEKRNHVEKGGGTLLTLGRVNRAASYTTGEFIAKL